ncbi:hypothetical protein PS15p_212004 [Mucor circinelloides]
MNKSVLEMDEAIDKVATQRTDLVRQLVMNNPTYQGAVTEDDAVTDDATVHEDVETTPVMSTSTSNNVEWLFNGVNISVLFCQYQVAVHPWF